MEKDINDKLIDTISVIPYESWKPIAFYNEKHIQFRVKLKSLQIDLYAGTPPICKIDGIMVFDKDSKKLKELFNLLIAYYENKEQKALELKLTNFYNILK